MAKSSKKRTKEPVDYSDLSIIIPAAGAAKRMASHGPKPLISLPDNRTIIGRQIDLLKTIFPKADIIVVLGHEADRIVNNLPRKVRVIENEKFAETSVSRSILLGLRASVTPKALVVYGDLVFSKEILMAIDPAVSSLLLGTQCDDTVGVTVNDGLVEHMDYGLNSKLGWLSIFSLVGNELREFKRVASLIGSRRLLGFEILNKIIDEGGKFEAVSTKGKLVQVEQSKDLKQIGNVVK